MAGIEVTLEAFQLPNYLRVKEWTDHFVYPVGHLSDEMAAQYWDEMKPLWLEHVRAKHAAWKAAGSQPLAGSAPR